MFKYFVGNDDFQLDFETYTKIKGKIVTLIVQSYVGGIRKTSD